MTATVGETATLVHGWTMAEVDKIAVQAAHRRGRFSVDFTDGYDAAWHAVVEMLYTTADPPTRRELYIHAANTVERVAATDRRHRGISSATWTVTPSFTRYWLPVIGGSDDFTEGLTDRLALPQVLSQLTDRQYQAVAALAAFGSQQEAADSLGIEKRALNERLRAARRRIEELWYAPETPHHPIATETHCRAGHARDTHGSKDARGKWRCDLCGRNGQRLRKARQR